MEGRLGSPRRDSLHRGSRRPRRRRWAVAAVLMLLPFVFVAVQADVHRYEAMTQAAIRRHHPYQLSTLDQAWMLRDWLSQAHGPERVQRSEVLAALARVDPDGRPYLPGRETYDLVRNWGLPSSYAGPAQW